jgi:hypothetical protein
LIHFDIGNDVMPRELIRDGNPQEGGSFGEP